MESKYMPFVIFECTDGRKVALSAPQIKIVKEIEVKKSGEPQTLIEHGEGMTAYRVITSESVDWVLEDIERAYLAWYNIINSRTAKIKKGLEQ